MENTELENVKSRKDQLFDKVRVKHPDVDFADDDAYYSQLETDYEDYDSRIADFEKEQSDLRALFDKDPRSTQFLSDWMNGNDPLVALWERYGAELMEDPSKKEALAEANKKYLERLAKEAELTDMYEKNIDASLDVLDNFQAKHGLSDAEVDEVLVFVNEVIRDGIVGKYASSTLEMGLKAVKHDVDVVQAGHEGEVRGRNEKINNVLKKQRIGDGTPRLDGKNNEPMPRRQRISMFELADEAM